MDLTHPSNPPLVSVITPTLNSAATLRACLESVAGQDYPAVEHLVMDGGSTDDTIELLRATPGVTWMSEPDEGQSDAINRGFRRSRGRLVTWLGADDLLEPGAVSAVVDAWRSDPSPVVVYGDCRISADDGDRLAQPPKKLRIEDFATGNSMNQPGTFIARDALDRHGLLDESFHYAMDFELWVRLLRAGGEFRYVPRTTATFVIHQGSKTGSAPTQRFLLEEQRALAQHGYDEAAGLTGGRLLAVAAISGTGAIDARRLRESLVGRTRTERAGAHLEAARLALGSPRQVLAHLANPDVWRCGLTRRTVTRRIGKRFAQALHLR